MFNLFSLPAALDKLVTQLRTPDSNARWVLIQLKRCATKLGQISSRFAHTLRYPKALKVSRRTRVWDVTLMLWFMLLVALAAFHNALGALVLVLKVPDLIAMHDPARLLMVPLAALLLSLSIGWCIRLFTKNRQAMKRHWPTLSTAQKLQSTGIFSVLCALAVWPSLATVF